jgi:hypothetical protein
LRQSAFAIDSGAGFTQGQDSRRGKIILLPLDEATGGMAHPTHLKRVYKIAPFVTEELTRRLEELKEERVRKRLRKK